MNHRARDLPETAPLEERIAASAEEARAEAERLLALREQPGREQARRDATLESIARDLRRIADALDRAYPP